MKISEKALLYWRQLNRLLWCLCFDVGASKYFANHR